MKVQNKPVKNLFYPGNRKFAVFLSHDVDRIKKQWFQVLYYFFAQKRFYHLLSLFQKKEPYWNFEEIIKTEKKYGVKSTFYFLNESIKFNFFKPKTWVLSLGRYNIFEKKVSHIIRKLDKLSWEIGLHGSYNSYRDKNLLKREKEDLEKILGKKIDGMRQHYLNLDIPKTWEIQHEFGLKYEASFGFKTKTGFRGKIYQPFSPFNNEFVVIPLTLMEINLFRENHNDLGKIWQKCLQLIDQAEKRGGLLSVLWHSQFFNKKEFPSYEEIYEKIIIECQKRNAWFATGREIAEYFKRKKDGKKRNQ